MLLKEIKINYQELTPTLETIEQMTNEMLMIVGQNGKLSIRREWERIQTKSHHINSTRIRRNLACNGAESRAIAAKRLILRSGCNRA